METLFVFLECTIVNLATYRHFTKKLEIELLKKKRERKKRKENQNCITSGLSQFLFLQQKM